MIIMEKNKCFINSESIKEIEKRMNKMFGFSDVKWLKQFLFKCKFDFLKDGTTRNCTLTGKMKINLKYGTNKVYVDFLGIIFYYENPDAFSFAQSILDFGQLCLGRNANIFLICLSTYRVSWLAVSLFIWILFQKIMINNRMMYVIYKTQNKSLTIAL